MTEAGILQYRLRVTQLPTPMTPWYFFDPIRNKILVKEPSSIILPVSYFPPISYFTCLASGNPIIIETGETYPKQTLRNRCEIAGSQGRQILVIPVTKPGGNHTRTSGVLASKHEDWRKKHWRALETAYSSSPYFLYYSDRIKEMTVTCPVNLADLDIYIIKNILSLLGISPVIEYSSDYIKEPHDQIDLRAAFSKNAYAWAVDLKPYMQVYSHQNGFIGNLSILDLLFNLGPETLSYLEGSKYIIPAHGVSA